MELAENEDEIKRNSYNKTIKRSHFNSFCTVNTSDKSLVFQENLNNSGNLNIDLLNILQLKIRQHNNSLLNDNDYKVLSAILSLSTDTFQSLSIEIENIINPNHKNEYTLNLLSIPKIINLIYKKCNHDFTEIMFKNKRQFSKLHNKNLSKILHFTIHEFLIELYSAYPEKKSEIEDIVEQSFELLNTQYPIKTNFFCCFKIKK